VWFSLPNKNCKPDQTAQLSGKLARTHPNQTLFFTGFNLCWFDLLFSIDWLGFEYP